MITVVLLNWRRPQNIVKLYDALMDQTCRPQIYLWDNSGQSLSSQFPLYLIEGISWCIQSSKNKQCPPRWWMAQQARTPYVMSFDDDLMPKDNKLLEDLLPCLDKAGPHRIVGAFGKLLNTGLDYEHCPASIPGEYCDIILGRVMAMHTKSLRLRLNWTNLSGFSWGTVDDIALSGMFYSKYKELHYCSDVFTDRLVELPDEFALCKEEGHFVRREAARRQWFEK